VIYPPKLNNFKKYIKLFNKAQLPYFVELLKFERNRLILGKCLGLEISIKLSKNEVDIYKKAVAKL